MCMCITDSLCSTPETNGASLVVQLVKNLSAMQETLVQFLGQEVSLEKATIPVFLDFPGG